MSDQIAVMNAGAVEQTGTPQEVYRRPKTRFVASFLGAMNWISGCGLRPEALRFSRISGPDSRPCIVVSTTFLGPVMHVEARLPNGETCIAQISTNGEPPFAQGEAVHVSWHSSDELTFP